MLKAKATPAQEDRRATDNKAKEIVVRLRGLTPHAVAELVKQKGGETFTYFEYPTTNWRQARTNYLLKRIICEIRQHTPVIRACPDGYSSLMLVAATLRHIASTKRESGDIWSSNRR